MKLKRIISIICAFVMMCSNVAFAEDYNKINQRVETLSSLTSSNEENLAEIIGEAVLIITDNNILTALTNAGGAVQAAALKESADNAMKKKDTESTKQLLSQLKVALAVLRGESAPVVFYDVNSGAWYYDAVIYSVSNGIFKGMSETQFAPDMEITRGMFLTLMERMYKNTSVVYEKSYADVPKDAYYANAVKWAKAEGILSFIEGDYFYPDKPITREELVTVLRGSMAAAGQDVDYMIQMKSFSDSSSISEWAKDNVAWAAAKKVVTGFEDGSFRPHSTATRAQVAQIFYNQR